MGLEHFCPSDLQGVLRWHHLLQVFAGVFSRITGKKLGFLVSQQVNRSRPAVSGSVELQYILNLGARLPQIQLQIVGACDPLGQVYHLSASEEQTLTCCPRSFFVDWGRLVFVSSLMQVWMLNCKAPCRINWALSIQSSDMIIYRKSWVGCCQFQPQFPNA